METHINLNINKENIENKISHEKTDTSENIQLVSNNNKNNNYNQLEVESEISTSTNEEDRNFKRIGILTSTKPYYLYKKLGRTYTLFGDKDGSPFIVIGPHWCMYAWFCSIMVSIYIFLLFHYWNYMKILFRIAGVGSFLTYFISYTFIFLANPGIPKYDENAILGKPREKYSICKRCGIWRSIEKNTYHCFDCDICIEGYDHHCPWTGKCIAKKNLNAFYIFLVSILGAFCFFITGVTHAQYYIYLEKKNLNKKFL